MLVRTLNDKIGINKTLYDYVILFVIKTKNERKQANPFPLQLYIHFRFPIYVFSLYLLRN